jgi:peptidyl-prolyl cis-trans isomerase SurA
MRRRAIFPPPLLDASWKTGKREAQRKEERRKIMKKQLTLAILALAGTSPVLAQLAPSHLPTVPAEPQGKPVARVNRAVLTDRDLVREEYAIFPYARQHNGVPAGMEADIRAGALKMIEFEELVYQEALRRGMAVSPERLQKAEAEFRKQFASPQQYYQNLKTEFQGSPTVLRRKIRRSLLIEDLLHQEVEDKASVSVAQAREFYDNNPLRFQYPEAFAFQSISILPPPNANAAQVKEARKRADDALDRAQATRSYDEFGYLAEKISDDDFRVMMGDHQAADRSKLPPAVVNALASMQPGQVSGLIEFDRNQYTVLRLKEHIDRGKRRFQDVEPSLREWLKKQKTEQLRRDLDARLRIKAKVEEF